MTAPRLHNLPNYPFADLGKRIQKLNEQGKDVIQLDMGSPDLPPAPAVIDALAKSAARPDRHGYAGYRGTPDFRKAVAKYYQNRFGVEVDSNREVLPLLGSKEGIVNLTLAMIGPGDVALVPSIAYPAYAMGTLLAEGTVFEMPLLAENKFLPVFSDIPTDVLEKAKLLWVNYPNNPTAAFCDLNFYEEAVAFCREHNILLCSDNAYIEVTFDGLSHAPSALQIAGAKDVTVEFISTSKSYNMAGWRLGAAVGNEAALDALLKVKSNVDSGHFHSIYDAGIVAFETTTQEWLDERNACYARRRDKILSVLSQLRLEVDEPPKGSLYVWARVVGMSDTEYTEKALLEAGVSITPGSVYGNDGKGYVRISLGISDARLNEAIERLLRLWN
ncbi:MAG: aminotransferase class I/II-fold pyridoxal phosphate-dependent enzyme [Anaerolineales bacterium]|nr:aminotransferase class I/II-fold pyridoxal phosphate-dependent enzyme [Anaerolineales bacterium]